MSSNNQIKDRIIFNLEDGGIIDFDTGRHYLPGCPTCDFGSVYSDEIEITMTKYRFYVSIDSMYDYALSDGWLMKTMLRNAEQLHKLTESEFIDWFSAQLNAEGYEPTINVYPENE